MKPAKELINSSGISYKDLLSGGDALEQLVNMAYDEAITSSSKLIHYTSPLRDLLQTIPCHYKGIEIKRMGFGYFYDEILFTSWEMLTIYIDQQKEK